jgi:hypothetical protein
MTPEERKLIADLFDRLASLEDNPRDPGAVDAINEGLDRAPNAVYALVQTVLVQDEALKRADARIRDLEGGAEPAPPNTSFLGGLRDQMLGRREEPRAGSVPSVRPAAGSGGVSSAWRNTGTPAAPAQQPQYAPAPEPAPQGGGSSFLGTAAAAAAGVVGGSLLMGGIRSMMGQGHARSAFDPGSGSRDAPWGGGSGGGGGELSRQAGLDDMGKAPRAQATDEGNRSGLFDSSSNAEPEQEDYATDDGGDEGDFDTDDLGGDVDGGDNE